MSNVDKKIIIIIILSLIIIGLIWFGFSRGSYFETIIEQIQGQRISLIRSTAIIESENSRVRTESAELRKNYIQSEQNNIKSEEDNIRLQTENKYYRGIIGEITAGSKETDQYLGEYGRITDDFAEFLRQATITD